MPYLNKIIIRDISNIISTMLEFSHSAYNQSSTSTLVNDAIKLLKNFPNVGNCAFITMDQETFEFEVHTVCQSSKIENFIDILDFISGTGAIGAAFQTGSFHSVHYKLKNEWLLLLPITSLNSYVGLFVLTSGENYEGTAVNIINLFQLFSRNFGMIIENKDLSSKIKQSSDLLDQLVASRTIELVENNQQLGEKIELLKANLSMSIPHEVRTPINEILGMVNYLKSVISNYEGIGESDKADILEIVGDISTSANRLRALFENFIYHTRLTVMSTSLKEMEILQSKLSHNCDSIIYEQAYLKAQFYDRSQDLDINLVSATIKISEEYLSKLIDELIDNAMKYSPKGTKVSIYSSIERNTYNLTIIDYGPGIPKEYINIVDAYAQFDRLKNEQQGLGLGLAIVYKIVDLHNGIIEIESELNAFTKISIKFLTSTDSIYD